MGLLSLILALAPSGIQVTKEVISLIQAIEGAHPNGQVPPVVTKALADHLAVKK